MVRLAALGLPLAPGLRLAPGWAAAAGAEAFALASQASPTSATAAECRGVADPGFAAVVTGPRTDDRIGAPLPGGGPVLTRHAMTGPPDAQGMGSTGGPGARTRTGDSAGGA
jgi:hypothetical protein